MIRCFRIVCLALLMPLSPLPADEIGDMAERLATAHRGRRPLPVLSAARPDLDAETAYRVQSAYVRRMLSHDRIAGFKAGLTSEAGRERFGVGEPLAGVLFATGRMPDGSVVERGSFRKLMIETEIGFVVGSGIVRPLQSVSDLRRHVRVVLPAIELPDLGFEEGAPLRAVDIIAANVSVARFIPGTGVGPGNVDLDAVRVTLTRDGKIVNRGAGADAMGGAWAAALWLVNTTIANGWTIDPGQILITGTLGSMISAEPGRYVADYGEFGRIEFQVE